MTPAARDYRIKKLEAHVKRTESDTVKTWARIEIFKLRAEDFNNQDGIDIDSIHRQRGIMQ